MSKMLGFFKAFVLVFCLALHIACSSVDKKDIDNLNNGNITVIGHAGSAFLYPFLPFNPLPPNSKASLEKALFKNMADGVEVDLQMSKDSVLVLFHDSDLDVIGRSEACVSGVDAAEVLGQPFDTGAFYNMFHDEEVISFESLLSWFSTFDRYPTLHLDVKNFDQCLSGNQDERAALLARKVHRMVGNYSVPLEDLFIGSSDKTFLKAMKMLDRQYVLMLDENADFDQGMRWVLEHQMAGMVIGRGIADKKKIEQAHHEGLFVVVFGGRSRSSIIEIIKKNPDAIQVNNVGTLKDLLQ